jgi:RND family efflux transporter MFP subunit
MTRKSTILLMIFLFLGQSHPAFAQLDSITVTLLTMPEQRSFDGRIEAINQATVSAETRGRIEDIKVDIGDVVVTDTVLLTIVRTEQRAGLTQAEANVAEAKSNLAAETFEFQRIKDLFSREYIAKTEMDKANARLSAATAKLASAQAAINSAKEQLSYTEVRAPFAGIVSARYVEPGELVQPGTLLMSGYDPNALRVEVDVPQTIAQKVRKLLIARVIPMSGDTIIDAISPTKLILYPTADPVTSTVRVRLELSSKAKSSNNQESSGQKVNIFNPGEFVKVLFTVGETQRLLVPLSSVVYRSEVTAVYILHDGKPALRQIRPGAIFANQLEVLAGLRAGDIVAIDPIAAATIAAATIAAATPVTVLTTTSQIVSSSRNTVASSQKGEINLEL